MNSKSSTSSPATGTSEYRNMADTFQLEIVTPEKQVVKGVAAEEAQIPGENGYLGVLPGHAPLISELKSGALTYRAGGKTHTVCVAWGFVEVLPDKVTILAETAERPQDIDVPRAEKAKARAEERLKSNNPDVDYDRAEDALERAESRIKVAAEK